VLGQWPDICRECTGLTERGTPGNWFRARAFLHTIRPVAFRHLAWPRAQANEDRTTHRGSEVRCFSGLYPLPGGKGGRKRTAQKRFARIQG